MTDVSDFSTEAKCKLGINKTSAIVKQKIPQIKVLKKIKKKIRKKKRYPSTKPTIMYLLATEKYTAVKGIKGRDKIVRLRQGTYIGVTNDMKRRLRQHRGEIKGGARSTAGRDCDIVCYVSGFPHRSVALRYEWRMHRQIYGGFKGTPIIKRLKVLMKTISMDRVTSKAPKNDTLSLTIHWNKKYKKQFEEQFQNDTEEKDDEKQLYWPANVKHEIGIAEMI